MKNCQFCAEEIKLDAIKCSYCGEFVSTPDINNNEPGYPTSNNDDASSESLPPMFMFSVIMCMCFIALFFFACLKVHDYSSAIKSIVAAIVFFFIAPYIWRAADALREYAEPTAYFGSGFWDMVGKRFFWTYGPQTISLIAVVIVMGLFVGLPHEKAVGTNLDQSSSTNTYISPANQAIQERANYTDSAGAPIIVKKMIDEYSDLNSKCRGGAGDNPETFKSCNARQLLAKEIDSYNWCHGRENEISPDMVWHECENNSLRAVENIKWEPEELVAQSTNLSPQLDKGVVTPVSEINKPNNSATPSFDCNNAKSESELLICSDQELSNLDSDLAVMYQIAKSKAIDSKAFKENTKAAWKWRESACRDKECLVNWYAERNMVLGKVIQDGT